MYESVVKPRRSVAMETTKIMMIPFTICHALESLRILMSAKNKSATRPISIMVLITSQKFSIPR